MNEEFSSESMTLSTSPLIKLNVPQDELLSMTERNQNSILTNFHRNTLASLFAGVGSGMASSVACAPLDLVRTRMQVTGSITNTKIHSVDKASQPLMMKSLRDIIKKDGITGCFRGLGVTLVTVPTFWGVYFPLYEHFKNEMKEDGNIKSFPFIHMSSAILSGAIADFFCNPLFVVRTRMQTEGLHNTDSSQHGILKTVKMLYKEGGAPIFWRGFTASLLGLSHVGIQFPVYEYLKSEAKSRSRKKEESPLDVLLASGLSKMMATTITYPHEVVRSRMMDHRGMNKSKGIVRVLKTIVRKEGFSALYAGIHVSLIRVLPNCCITFMTYEMILRWTKTQICNN